MNNINNNSIRIFLWHWMSITVLSYNHWFAVDVAGGIMVIMMGCHDGAFVSLYKSFTHTYGMVQATELHHYFSLVVWRGVKQCFMSVGQARFVCFTPQQHIFQLYYGGDKMHEMKRKQEPTLVLTQGIFKLPHHKGTV